MVACLALLMGSGTAWGGELTHHTLASAVLARPWNISVYLPAGYNPARRYPMMVFLPGNGATSRDVTQLGIEAAANAEIAAGHMPPAVIVVPELGRSWGLNGAEAMETALMRELLPEARQRWNGLGGRRGLVIGGISAGGFAALRLAMLHPEQFAAAVLLSPAVYVPQPPANSAARRADVFGTPNFQPEAWTAANYPALMKGMRASGQVLPLFVASGTEDNLGIGAQAVLLSDAWRLAGQPAELLLVPGGHETAVWRQLMPRALAYGFRHTAAPSP